MAAVGLSATALHAMAGCRFHFDDIANANELSLLPSGALAGVFGGGTLAVRAFWLDPGTLTHRDAVSADGNSLAIVSGALAELPGFLYVVRDEVQLGEIDALGTFSVLAQSTDPAWAWASAVAVPPGHPSTGGKPAFLVLEGNRARDLDRIVRIVPP